MKSQIMLLKLKLIPVLLIGIIIVQITPLRKAIKMNKEQLEEWTKDIHSIKLLPIEKCMLFISRILTIFVGGIISIELLGFAILIWYWGDVWINVFTNPDITTQQILLVALLTMIPMLIMFCFGIIIYKIYKRKVVIHWVNYYIQKHLIN